MKKLKPKALLKVPLTVDFEIGRTQKTLEEVLEFKKGTVIKLDNSIINVIQVYANGKSYGKGKAVRKNGEMHVKISELNKKK